jgi:ribosomal protein S18 acetylase RimI-like enzyme
MLALMKSLSRHDVSRVYLEVAQSNAGAIRLYGQLGFQIIKSLHHYYGRGDHGVHMRYEFATR